MASSESLPNINPSLRDRDPPGSRPIDAARLARDLRQGDRAALSRAITVVESTRPDDRSLAEELVSLCRRDDENEASPSYRIAITGVPGAGKSTFIEALGHLLVKNGHRLAVLAIDPSSERSGGSILGDKTRMNRLASHPAAFIRPSPTRGALGGVTRSTREAMILCEAAGYEAIFVETVGVGQAEIAVHSLVDCFVLLAIAGAGDELQGIKRGIMEMADVLVVNKADGDNTAPAERAARTLERALRLLPPPDSGWTPRVHTCSALHETGIDDVWETLQAYEQYAKQTGYFGKKRRTQSTRWMYQLVEDAVRDEFYRNEAVRRKLTELEAEVGEGTKSPLSAAEELLAAYHDNRYC